MTRVYLYHNATTPLRSEARIAMLNAMDVVGNPSSVHAEGRASKAIVEKARRQVAEALGASSADIVFTSSATESAALACAGRNLYGALIEHDALKGWINTSLPVSVSGLVVPPDPSVSVLQLANSETGVVQNLPIGLFLSDLTQGFGKIPFKFDSLGCDIGIISGHKLGGPKGVGAVVCKQGVELSQNFIGGGQEMGRRAGTENVIGIAGFGAAAEVAAQNIKDGVWNEVAKLRNILEKALESVSKATTFVGKGNRRLPNTSCFATPGWKGEMQVMQMDIEGFAISAGSACSSGKVKSTNVLEQMGLSYLSDNAVRVSLGPETTEDDVMRFAEIWAKKLKKYVVQMA
ncbi:MAG: cysteine desulfurase [Tateyamaria sp.]|nr:cysteine desulfurase [Tateyamaria sp.]